MRCICKKWTLFFSSTVWLMMTISSFSYVKKLLAVFPAISDQEYRSTILLVSIGVPAMILLPWLVCLVNALIRQYRRMKEKMIMDEVRRYLRENIHDDENRRVL
ncbi:MAG: hypothetical protein ACLRTA_05005, partial [Clostridia bacterium]